MFCFLQRLVRSVDVLDISLAGKGKQACVRLQVGAKDGGMDQGGDQERLALC